MAENEYAPVTLTLGFRPGHDVEEIEVRETSVTVTWKDGYEKTFLSRRGAFRELRKKYRVRKR